MYLYTSHVWIHTTQLQHDTEETSSGKSWTMWSTWVRSCHPIPPFENSSWKWRTNLKLSWICFSSKFHSPFPRKKRYQCESEPGIMFTKDSCFVYCTTLLTKSIKIHMHGGCLILPRLKNQTDEMLEDFESKCADLASWQLTLNFNCMKMMTWSVFTTWLEKTYLMCTWFPLESPTVHWRPGQSHTADSRSGQGGGQWVEERWGVRTFGWIWHLAFFQMRPWMTQPWVKFWLCQ